RHDSVLSSWGALAMFEWRHGLGDFRKRLKTAVESGVKAAQALLPYRTPRDYLAPIHLAPAMYLSRLTHRRFLPDLVSILPDFATWNPSRAYCSYCDRGHLIALERGAYPKKWPKLIDALFCKEPLTADTHACYAEIILLCHAGRHVEAVEEIGRAYKL